MIDVTLTIDGRNFASRLSTYSVSKEVSYSKTVTTINGKERYFGRRDRDVVVFSLIPTTELDALADYNALKNGVVTVNCSEPHYLGGVKRNVQMAVVSNLDSVFLLKSINGKVYYSGGEITLRALDV